jgi:hypothetical protein
VVGVKNLSWHFAQDASAGTLSRYFRMTNLRSAIGMDDQTPHQPSAGFILPLIRGDDGISVNRCPAIVANVDFNR